jgi:hypothetical protein
MILCKQCHRHVRETVCPFCSADNRAATPLLGPAAMRVGIKRSALIVGVMAATTGACSASTGGEDVVAMDAAYGIPYDAGNDVIAVDAAYGIPYDGGGGDVVTDAAVYGIPDASPNDVQDSSPSPPYGVPPDGF